MDNRVYLCFTMDCELTDEHSPQGGPADWGLSERAIAGYASTLEGLGLRATYFAIAGTAVAHRDLFCDLASRGHEVGLHCHPQNRDLGYGEFLGGMSRARQVECLRRCQETFAEAMGSPASAFRPGNFSASDETFGVLLGLGMDHGSVSLPGRHLEPLCAVWPQAEPFPHWADLRRREASGGSGFLEVPVTGDLTRPGYGGQDGYDVPHLRLERPDLPECLASIVEMNLRALADRTGIPRAICFMTHNTRDYGDAGEPARANLVRGAECVREMAARLSLSVTGATMEQVRDAALRLSGRR